MCVCVKFKIIYDTLLIILCIIMICFVFLFLEKTEMKKKLKLITNIHYTKIFLLTFGKQN